MNYICLCNNCNTLLLDTNPQVNAKQFEVDSLQLAELEQIEDMRACPNCKTDDYLTDDVYRKLWEMLGDICTDEEWEIESDFLHFPTGTHKYDIWHWFEETFNISVAIDLI